jgi:DNA mismatch repair protein MSH5
MDVRLNEEAEEIEEEITYLFNLLPGRGESSLASSCAAKNGVDGEVIERAEDIILYQETNEDLAVVCRELPEEDQKNAGLARSRAQRFLEMEAPGSSDGIGELGSLRNALEEVIYQEDEEGDEIDEEDLDLAI